MSAYSNPYILFLILILLILGMDPESDKKLGTVKTLLEKASSALSNLKTGVHSLQTDVEDMHVMMMSINNPRWEKRG